MTLAYKADEFFEPLATQTADRRYLADRRFSRRRRTAYQIETGLEEAPVITVSSGSPPSEPLLEAIQATITRFATIKALENGWDSYTGQRIQKGAIVHALGIALIGIQRCHPPRVELNSEGGVDLIWESAQRTLSLSVNGAGAFEIYYEDGEHVEEPGAAVGADTAAEYALKYCS